MKGVGRSIGVFPFSSVLIPLEYSLLCTGQVGQVKNLVLVLDYDNYDFLYDIV